MQQNINKSGEELTVQNSGGLPEWLTLRNGLIMVLIVAVCVAVLITHWPVLSAQALFLLDDKEYFVENFLVRNPSWLSAKRFLTEVFEPSTVRGYYQPLTMISLMLDYALGGQTDSLWPFHLTNLALHVANTALIIVLLYQLFGQVWIAAGVGLLFGVHPLTVEPVAWIVERKTVLATFFALWSLVFYVRFARRGTLKTYVGCIVLYLLSLMSKPTSTPLPVLMLLMDYWPLRRLKWRTILEKLPLFVVGGISSVITYISQSLTASVTMPQAYGPMRIPLLICRNIVFYLYKIVWPAEIFSYYVFPDPPRFSNPMIMVSVVGTCVLIALLVLSLRWTRAAITGFSVFFVAILPTMQILQFSNVVASDKFVYLPSIGLLMILAVFLGWICGAARTRRHTVRCVVVAIIVLMLAGAEAIAARRHLMHWKDTVSLFTHMVRMIPNTVPLHNNFRNALGIAFAEQGDIKRATECFTEVLKMKPDNTDAHLYLGKILADQGRYDEAMTHYNEVLRLKSDDAVAYQHIGTILVEQGHFDEAIAMLRKGLEYKPPNSSILHTGLGTLLLQQGKLDEAISELQIAVKLRPDSMAFNNLGAALSSKGRIEEAMECHKKAIQFDPKNAEAYFNLANVLMSQEKFTQAIGKYEKALRINPKYTKAHINFGAALMEEGWLDEAIKHFAEAARIEPNNVMAHYNLAMALVDVGWLEEAAREYRQVLQLQPADANTHCVLGDVLVRLGRSEEATAEYLEALRINPQHAQAQQGLKNIPPKQQPGRTTK
jgi:tetratricopeptide (TPR) repeat protein